MPKTPRLLICCEGETEKQYVMAVVAALHVKHSPKVLNPAASDPMGVLAEAYKEYSWSQAVDPVPFTEIWLVFDRDHHPTYDRVFELAPKLGPEIHLCWTNPCIEFWFWLHYSADASELKFDDELELFREEKTVDLGGRLKEVTCVRRVLQTIKPETMLSALKQHCSGYSKVHCPQGLVELTVRACDNLQVVAQSEDPAQLGSAMPDLLLRLARLAKEASSSGAEPMAAEAAPDEQAEAPVLSVVSTAEKTEAIRNALHFAPSDPWKACVVPLLNCLEDWKTIRVTDENVTVTQAAIARLQQFFRDLKVAEESVPGSGRRSKSCLATAVALEKTRKLAMTPARIAKMRLQLASLGSVLRLMAKKFGLQGSVESLDFDLKSGAGLLPLHAEPAALPTSAASKDSAEQLAKTAAPKPAATAAVEPSSKSVPEKTPEEVLKLYLAELKELQADLQRVMKLVILNEGEAPQETMPGLCDKAAYVEKKALALVESCSELLAQLPVEEV